MLIMDKYEATVPCFVAVELGFLLRMFLFFYIYVDFRPSRKSKAAPACSRQIDIAMLV
jgi:hypothetical protein